MSTVIETTSNLNINIFANKRVKQFYVNDNSENKLIQCCCTFAREIEICITEAVPE